MMSDEIDIEEHDLLEHPNLRKIFPDLSVIKEEIRLYEQGEEIHHPSEDTHTRTRSHTTTDKYNDLQSNLENNEENLQKAASKKLEVHLRFKTFLDSLEDDYFSENTDTTDVQSNCNENIPDNVHPSSVKSNETIEETKYVPNNILILGSKPSARNKRIVPRINKLVKIVLENVTPYLNSCKQYCKQCHILFPNVNALSIHLKKVHPLKTSNSTERKLSIHKSSNNKFQCNMCTSTLCSRGNLVRHYKSVHKVDIDQNLSSKSRKSIKRLRQDTKVVHKNSIKSDKDNIPATNATCFHCTEIFETRSSLIEHLYEVITPKKTISENSKQDKLTKSHYTVVANEVNDDINSNVLSKSAECSICAIKFSTQKKLDQHNQLTHSNKKDTNVMTDNNSYENVLEQSNRIGGESTKKNDDKIERVLNRPNNSNIDNTTSLRDKNESKTIIKNYKTLVDNEELVYQCFICYKYFLNFSQYSVHMTGHNIHNASEKNTTLYKPKCNYCSSQFNNIHNFNRHISIVHDKINIFVGKAFHSVVFKCAECNIFLLSAYAAVNHSEHKAMEKWKCEKCQKLFRELDKTLHLKQHALSNNFTSYELCKSALKRVLYKCLKCGIHFREEEYLNHNGSCDSEIPNSTYCSTCHILIYENDLSWHSDFHKHKNLQAIDFTLVESDIIIDKLKPEVSDKNTKLKFALTFCHGCKCFVRCHGTKHETGKTGLCAELRTPKICLKCGLVFTPRGYLSHKSLHDKMENINIQSFYFYDIVTEKPIRPPFKYPTCSICKVHYINTPEFKRSHECSKQIRIKCEICSISLTETAYKLHQNYHSYKLPSDEFIEDKPQISDLNALTATTSANDSQLNTAKPIINNISESALNQIETITSTVSDSNLDKEKSIPQAIRDSNVDQIITSTVNSSNSSEHVLSPVELRKTLKSFSRKTYTKKLQIVSYVFICTICDITFDTYDKVVEHCHRDHYDFEKKTQNDGYKTMHLNSSVKNDKLVILLQFDPFYFRFSNDVWIKHVFSKQTQYQIKELLKDSMYKFECRLQMEEIQSGELLIYKCDICESFISPHNLYSHATIRCVNVKKYECSTCGIFFFSLADRTSHQKIHERITNFNVSYRIILYNKKEHVQYVKMIIYLNNKYVVYQCRNCTVVVDKVNREKHQCENTELIKCSHCGLLFYHYDLRMHSDKHSNVSNYDCNSIVVILFGKITSKVDMLVKPSFNGTIHDFTFYKCTNCDVCIKSEINVSKHVCVTDSFKCKCSICELCFMNSEFPNHLELHECNMELGYDDFNSNILPFTPTLGINSEISAIDDFQDRKNNKISILYDKENSLVQDTHKSDGDCNLNIIHDVNTSIDLENPNIDQETNKSKDSGNTEVNDNNECLNIEKLNKSNIGGVPRDENVSDGNENSNIQEINKHCNYGNSENPTHDKSKAHGEENLNALRGTNDSNENDNSGVIHECNKNYCNNGLEKEYEANPSDDKDSSNLIEEINLCNNNLQIEKVEKSVGVTNRNKVQKMYKTDGTENSKSSQNVKETPTKKNVIATIINDKKMKSSIELLKNKRKSETELSNTLQKIKKTSDVRSNLSQNIETSNDNIETESTQIIYKCKCGLHFVEKFDAQKHCKNCRPRVKISKQCCFKCDLLFTPGELFNHLLKHHDKKLKCTFQIVELSDR